MGKGKWNGEWDSSGIWNKTEEKSWHCCIFYQKALGKGVDFKRMRWQDLEKLVESDQGQTLASSRDQWGSTLLPRGSMDMSSMSKRLFSESLWRTDRSSSLQSVSPRYYMFWCQGVTTTHTVGTRRETPSYFGSMSHCFSEQKDQKSLAESYCTNMRYLVLLISSGQLIINYI